MSDLDCMEKLLNGVEVEWKTLEEVGSFQRGKRFVKTDMISEGVPCIHYGEMYTHYDIWAKTTKSFVNKQLASKLRTADHGDVVIVAAGETIEDIGKGTAWLGEESIIIHDACFSYKSPLDPKYVSYFLRTRLFHDQIKPHISSGKISAINAKGLGKAKIPIPPLGLQARIVQTLDAFATLNVELTIELIARKQQYIYYRDQLLTFNKNQVEWTTLGKVSNIFDSLHQTPQYVESGLNMIRVTNIKGGLLNLDDTLRVSNETFEIFTKRYAPQKHDLVMSRVGSYGNVSIVPLDNAVCMGQNTVVIHPLINKSFLYHILLSASVQSFIERNVGGGSQKTLSLKSINAIPIPIVSAVEQARIASILDKFDMLANSFTEGLPREIELRQQQYEYYRELLLSFPKTEVANHD